MALSKAISLDNGVTVTYHRVVSVNTVTNVQDIIEVASYPSREKREEERESVPNGIDMNVYIFTQFINAPYGECPTVASAYEWLKGNILDFADAQDVFEHDEA